MNLKEKVIWINETNCEPHIAGCSEDFGQNDSRQTISAVVQGGDGQLQQVLLVFQTAYVQQTDVRHKGKHRVRARDTDICLTDTTGGSSSERSEFDICQLHDGSIFNECYDSPFNREKEGGHATN